jgi:hypothetical protein
MLFAEFLRVDGPKPFLILSFPENGWKPAEVGDWDCRKIQFQRDVCSKSKKAILSDAGL